MIDPYRMIIVNSIVLLALCLGVLFYRYIYPKRKVNLFVLLLLISMLPLISILRSGAYESGDFTIHIYRIMSFYDSLKEGIFMPSWAAELNASYGNPLFIFNYSFSYYLISLFHFIGLSFIASTKLYLGLNLFLSGIFMYILVRELTGNKLAAFTSSIFYLFNPYHLVDIHFRATLGESTIFTIAPLVLYFLTKYFKKKQLIFLTLSSLFTFLLFLAHPLLALIFVSITSLYVLFWGYVNKNFRLSILAIISLVVGSISAFYTVISFPLYAPYTFPHPAGTQGISSEIFYNFNYLFYSPWRYGFLFQGHQGELALIIGYTQLCIMLGAVFLLFKKIGPSQNRLQLLFWILLFFFFLLLMHPASQIFWKFFPSLWMLLPFGRLSLALALCTSLIAGYFTLLFSTSKTKKRIIYILILMTIISTILNWGHRKVIPEINDTYLRQGVWKSTLTEGTTAYFLNNKWADINHFWFSELPKNHLEILKGEATIKELKRTSTKHLYIIDAETPLTIRENTLYFPGWFLKSNDKLITIYPGERGVINAKLPQGLQYIEVAYDDILEYKISKIISVTIFLSLVTLLTFQFIRLKIKRE
ncbi:MAG: hypothetical protein AAB553_06775 [Patescibacteria group bacterium]